jgi:cellulose synthase/poly-beta-1,6-N-acetylglucosamine synthase-like glycosyltransferase
MMTLIMALVLVLIGAGLAYLYALLAAGGKGSVGPQVPDRQLRLAVALPAHNEEAVIGASVLRLLQCDYPREAFDIHIVADYCTDRTAAAAATAGAVTHVRNEGPRGRKGYAVGWLIQQLLAHPKAYEAIVVFDADSRVDPAFLQHINKALNHGAQVIQGRHIIANPSDSTFSALADADMRLNNRIRNQAKTNLGLSARLMGDAMCFHRCVLEAHPWTHASSLAEDREYGIHLATQGIRVVYAPEAVSAGQATARWKDAGPQRLRWYGGVFELQRRYVHPLLTAAWRDKNLAALDLALELLLPPFSTLALLAVASTVAASLLVSAGLTTRVVAVVATCLLFLTMVFPVIGLAVEHAPPSAYRALLHGPVYALWRFSIGLRATLRRGNVPWIRTRRAEEIESK